MRYKLLLTGGNKGIINDFFTQLNDDFECLTSSTLYPDIIGHLQYYNPDAVVYCMNAESRDSMTTLISVHYHMQKAGIPLVLICDSEDNSAYHELRFSSAELLLIKPITTSSIHDKLIYYLKEKAPKNKKPFPVTLSADVQSLPEHSDLTDTDTPQEYCPDYNSLMEELSVITPRKRILVIDDAAVMLKTINEHLKQDYDVATAINGKLARKYLEGRTVDLILLDYEMPDENGPAVFQKLQSNPLTANIPVIFLTGINDSAKIQKALSLKPAGYLLKPVDKSTLLEKIHEIIG